MAQLKYCDKHNQVGFLFKPAESAGYTKIVDFLRSLKLRYALTHNPPIYDSLVKQFWQTATARTLADGTQQLNATIDSIDYTITEESVRRQLQLADASGINMLQNEDIFVGLQNIGSKSGGWDQFGSNIATALICLSTGRDFNFSKLIFDGMISNLKSKSKFLMYPRFLQMILNIQTENKNLFVPVLLTKKIFGNMKRSFQGIHRPLLPAMLTIDAGQPQPSAASTPSQPEPTTSPSHVQIPTPSITSTPPSIQPPILTQIKRKREEIEDEEDEEGQDQDIPSQTDQGNKFVTPKKNNDSEEAQAEQISPSTLEAAQILTNVASEGFKGSQAPSGSKIYKRKPKSTATPTKVLDFEEPAERPVNTASIAVNTERVQRREGKAPMTEEDLQAERARASRGKATMDAEAQKQIHLDELLARRLVEEEEKAANAALVTEFDYIQARLNADQILAEKIQQEEREQYSIEDRAKFLHDTIAAQRKFLAEQRYAAIRNKPPTRSQLRNQMITYLKHVANKKHAELKSKSFEEIQVLYERYKKQDQTFVAIGSEEDERAIKNMNEKAANKEKDQKAESVHEEVKKEEEAKKRKLGTRRKLKAKGRKHTSGLTREDDDLKMCLHIAPDEDKLIDVEILDRQYPIVEWKSFYLTTKPQYDPTKPLEDAYLNMVTRSNGNKRFFRTLMGVLSIFDREDLKAVYELVMEKYQDEIPEGFDKMLWGDLIIMFNQGDTADFWDEQLNWKIISWKLHSSSGVHTIMTSNGLVIHMLVENRYPLTKEVLSQLLDLKLETEEESTMALELIKFVKQQLEEFEDSDDDDLAKSDHEEAERV
ncbi:hypothetical protein Tco_0251238 [Tanacetum coccineum]